MKSLALVLMVALLIPQLIHAQANATDEQLARLRAEVSALQTANVDLQKRLSEVIKELQEIRVQSSKPSGDYASAEDAKRLADAIKEVDRKREADRDLILGELKKLSKSAAAPAVPESGSMVERGIEYVIEPGNTISGVVQACRDKGMKVTVDDILKANPGLKPNNLQVGQKIFIPVTTR
jgi:LysM repeat protein